MANVNGNSAKEKKDKKDKNQAQASSNISLVLDPVINSNGICLKCSDVHALESSVQCRICDKLFHATCYDIRCNASAQAICSKSFFNLYKPLTVKYGQNSERFGKVCFLCTTCDLSLVKKSPKDFSDVVSQTDMSAINTTDTDLASLNEDKCTTICDPNYLQNKFNLLSDDVIDMKTSLTSEISSLKAMITKLSESKENPNATSSNSGSHIPQTLSYAEMIAGSAPFPEQKQQLIHISATDANNLSSEELKTKVESVKSKLTKSFKNIPTNFVTTNNQKGSLTVAFPDATIRQKGSQIINELNLSANGFQFKDGKKMFPKLTVTGVGCSVFDGIDYNLPETEKRLQWKAAIKSSIISKNECIRVLTEHGHTLDVVYINYSENNQKLTVALKVSPSIRNALFQTQQGHVYIGNSSLPIEDRFFFKQCFHCQEIGHFSSDCPKSADSPVCFYCMGPHQSKNCSKKRTKSDHCCSKCYNSKVPSEKSNCKSHNAADPQCPVILREIQKIVNNTDTISKNVM